MYPTQGFFSKPGPQGFVPLTQGFSKIRPRVLIRPRVFQKEGPLRPDPVFCPASANPSLTLTLAQASPHTAVIILVRNPRSGQCPQSGDQNKPWVWTRPERTPATRPNAILRGVREIRGSRGLRPRRGIGCQVMCYEFGVKRS